MSNEQSWHPQKRGYHDVNMDTSGLYSITAVTTAGTRQYHAIGLQRRARHHVGGPQPVDDGVRRRCLSQADSRRA
jgi:hypothetical protein